MSLNFLQNKTALLLDMNHTFMFGEDRFDKEQDYSVFYHQIGGSLPRSEIQSLIQATYAYLEARYPDPEFRECFPSVQGALTKVSPQPLPPKEIQKIVDTFAHHERGHIPSAYVGALQSLAEQFALAVVADIWAPSHSWRAAFDETGITPLFSALLFSSDYGMVKPSPKLFEFALETLEISPDDALVIGDSVRRDLGGASAAGIECVLVGGATHPSALGSFESLLEWVANI